MSKGADVVIVGGGLMGCSTAVHCAAAGLSVIVLERFHVARHASGANAGGVRRLMRHPAEIPLSLAAMEKWHRIAELVDDDCGFAVSGQVLVAETEAEMETIRKRHAEVSALGYDHEELIDAEELYRLVPALVPGCVGGLVCRDDGFADPFRTSTAFRRKAEALGVDIREGSTVTDFYRKDGYWRVETEAGYFDTHKVVNCAGSWAHRFAERLGEPVPLEPFAPMMMVTARMPAFVDPVVLSVGRSLSFKQSAVGTVLIGGGHPGRPDMQTGASAIDFAELGISARTVLDLFPVMRSATLVRAWAGIEGKMPDGIPVIGPSTTEEGLFHAFGFCGHGFQISPIVGRIMSELVMSAEVSLPISPFAIDRF